MLKLTDAITGANIYFNVSYISTMIRPNGADFTTVVAGPYICRVVESPQEILSAITVENTKSLEQIRNVYLGDTEEE